MIQCPACGKSCMPTATRCKSCGADFAEKAFQGQVDWQKESLQKATGATRATKGLIAVGITLAALGFFAMIVFWMAEYRGWVIAGALLALAGIGTLIRAISWHLNNL